MYSIRTPQKHSHFYLVRTNPHLSQYTFQWLPQQSAGAKCPQNCTKRRKTPCRRDSDWASRLALVLAASAARSCLSARCFCTCCFNSLLLLKLLGGWWDLAEAGHPCLDTPYRGSQWLFATHDPSKTQKK